MRVKPFKWATPEGVKAAGSKALGQSSVEMIVALPIVLFLGAAGVQLAWLLLAKHILLTATSYVALYAAVAPEDVTGQQLIFQQRIKPVQPGDLVVPRIRLITPDADLTQRIANYDINTNRYSFDPTYAHLQLGELMLKGKAAGIEQAEQWLKMSNLKVEIVWCFRIQVPGMGVLLQQAFYQRASYRGGGCEVYNVLKDGYYIPLRAEAQAPLHTNRQWRLE